MTKWKLEARWAALMIAAPRALIEPAVRTVLSTSNTRYGRRRSPRWSVQRRPEESD
jgi:hypothetical protein